MKTTHFNFPILPFLLLVATLAVSGGKEAQAQNQSQSATQQEDNSGSIQSGPYDSAADPFSDFENMQLRLTEMLRRFMSSDLGNSLAAFNGQFGLQDFDVIEQADAFMVYMDAPGMQKDKIDIQIKDEILTVNAKREELKENAQDIKDGRYYYRGRSMSAFERRLELPPNIKVDQISAQYNNGVLTIRLPKTEEKTPEARKIPVS